MFPARRVITMNPSNPIASAVAVRDGHIVEVGSRASMQPWLERHPHRIDDRFSEHVILPGLIDPHLHPSMAAVLLPMDFITGLEWRLPWETVKPVKGREAFLGRLGELHRLKPDASTPLLTWGYHSHWHGRIERSDLNTVTTTRPIVVWHRSFHEVVLNDAALAWLDIDESGLEGAHQIDVARGRFFETGLRFAIARMNPYLLAPQRFKEGLRLFAEVAHFGGHTTIGDMATGIFNLSMEWEALCDVLDKPSVPFRVELVPHLGKLGREAWDERKALAYVRGLHERNTAKLRFSDHVKLFADGAFFSQLAQLSPPGYIDGHQGEWMTTPEVLEVQARTFWNAGYKIHVHTTGDLGLELVLQILEKLQWERPRFNHGFTIEHFGFSHPEQVERLAALGASVSANVYYLHELSDTYAREGIGVERAHSMARIGSCVAAGIRTAIHSDFTMAPALPLHNAWVAATRINHAGEVVAPQECLSLEAALRAITIDAAHVLGRANEVGSLRAGKRADFAVVDSDPCEVGADGLSELEVLATVFEGAVHEVS